MCTYIESNSEPERSSNVAKIAVVENHLSFVSQTTYVVYLTVDVHNL